MYHDHMSRKLGVILVLLLCAVGVITGLIYILRQPVMVQSADGVVSLSIPRGALPPGTSARDIRITPSQETYSKQVLAAYTFTPTELTFKKPVSLTWQSKIPRDLIRSAMLLSVEKEKVAGVDGATVAYDEETEQLTTTAQIHHFSDYIIAENLFHIFGFLPGGKEKYVGQPFEAKVGISYDQRVVIPIIGGRTITKELVEDPYVTGQIWDARYTLSPDVILDSPKRMQMKNGGYTARETFTCRHEGGALIRPSMHIWYVYRSAFDGEEFSNPVTMTFIRTPWIHLECIDPNNTWEADRQKDAARKAAQETAGKFEFLSVPEYKPISTLAEEKPVYIIVASSGTLDIRKALPIELKITVDGKEVWRGKIAGNPTKVCRDATGCSVEGPVIKKEWLAGELVLTATGSKGEVLAVYNQ